MENGSEKIITFFSHYQALSFKRRYKDGELRPTPRSLSSSCNSALFIFGEIDMAKVDESVEAIYQKEDGKWKKIYQSG